MVSEIIFWQGSYSIHQSALLRSLAENNKVKVILVVWDEFKPGRKEMGWQTPNYGHTEIVVQPTETKEKELFSFDHSKAVHVFSGTRGHPGVWRAFVRGISSEAYLGIQSEAESKEGLKGILRLMRGRYDRLRFGERVAFIMAIGKKGMDWFSACGYAEERIFPFGYFVEVPSVPREEGLEDEESDNRFTLVFVGSPLLRKGLDILFYALEKIKERNWRLNVVGDGTDKEYFVRLASELGIRDFVTFYGKLKNSEAVRLISKSDLLVLPSRSDGWGAVVNEALMCGVPVVCSDQCGAADLLTEDERGEIFAWGAVGDLSAVLERRISQGKIDFMACNRIREWSKSISGESAAKYLLEVIEAARVDGKRPIAPWFSKSQ